MGLGRVGGVLLLSSSSSNLGGGSVALDILGGGALALAFPHRFSVGGGAVLLFPFVGGTALRVVSTACGARLPVLGLGDVSAALALLVGDALALAFPHSFSGGSGVDFPWCVGVGTVSGSGNGGVSSGNCVGEHHTVLISLGRVLSGGCVV